jgi:hypothetical protein
VVVFLTTIFALWSGIGDGLAALVIVQSESFADASRQLVQYVIIRAPDLGEREHPTDTLK